MKKKDALNASHNRCSLSTRVSACLKTVLVTLAVSLAATAQAHAQKTNGPVRMSNVAVEEVLNQIENTSSYSFLFNDQAIDVKRIVSVSSPDGDIAGILDSVFKGTGVRYRIVDNQIILSQNPPQQQTPATNQLRGVVRGAGGEPLLGVGISIQGTSAGTVTGADGSYTILAPRNGSVVVFSYIGYTTQTVVYDGRSQLDVVMQEQATAMDEVVVTALGIRREKKALTYNVQQLSSDELTRVVDANFINSLSGKLAGVTINSNSTGAGGSTRMQMRGPKSLFGNNNALYVIDGIPMPSLRTEQVESFYEMPDGGDGDGISHINPDDIETITALTGAAATALYGNEGANRVLLITTKKGVAGKTTVSYSNNTTFTSPFVMPEFQNTYGAEQGSYSSWGEKLVYPSDYSPRDFFQTGYNVSNSVSVATGNEVNQTYASLGAYNSRGIIPNNKYNRYNFNIRNSATLYRVGKRDIVSLDATFSYMKIGDQNQPRQGLYHNPLVPIYLFPPSDDISKYQVYETYNIERGFRTQNWHYDLSALSAQNPYWIINRSMFNTDRDRYMIGGNLTVSPLEWLNLSARARYDRTVMNYTRKIYASSLNLFASDYGNYLDAKNDYKSMYADVLANANFRWDDFTLTANLGASLSDYKFNSTGFEGHLLNVANWFHARNVDLGNHAYMNQDIEHTMNQSVFVTAQLGYKSLFLDLTGRNDWASQFAGTSTKSFFYPSVGFSAVITDMLDVNPKYLSFAKIRASYSEVGSPPPAYITKQSHTKEKEGGSGAPETTTIAPADYLKPERTKAFEIGANLSFFDNRLTLDFTYYNTNTYNQLFLRTVSPTKDYGYNQRYENAGKVNNRGFEIAASFRQNIGPVDWRTNVTFTRNKNKIVELAPGMEYMDIMTMGSYKVRLTEGGSIGDIYGQGLATDEEGNVFVDVNLGTIGADTETWYKLGDTDPKFNIGWGNTFSYKGFSLNFLISARIGGIGTSATQALMDQYGVSKATADARDRGGVKVNYGEITPNNWYSVVSGGQTGLLAFYTYSSTNVRLRELSLSYNMPSAWFRDKVDITLSLVGSNLFMFYNKAPYDPELTSSTGTYFQGFDYFRQPSTRSLGFGVSVKF